MPDDPLGTARGFKNGILAAAALWALILIALLRL
jgi:hypothetical protein